MVVLIPPHKVKPYVRGQRNDMNDALAIAEAVGGLPLLFAFGQWRWCSQGRFSERRPAVDGRVRFISKFELFPVGIFRLGIVQSLRTN